MIFDTIIMLIMACVVLMSLLGYVVYRNITSQRTIEHLYGELNLKLAIEIHDGCEETIVAIIIGKQLHDMKKFERNPSIPILVDFYLAGTEKQINDKLGEIQDTTITAANIIADMVKKE